MSPTFKDLYDFVLANKGNKSFIGYSDERIANMLYEHLYDNTVYYHTDDAGRIKGILLFGLCHEEKYIFILENMSMSIPTLKQFARMSNTNFPGYRWEAMRHGKHRKFSNKFYNRLISTI